MRLRGRVGIPLAALVGLLIGGAAVLLALALVRPRIAPTAPERAGASDLSMTISRELLVREANRRAGATLRSYDLSDPRWELGEEDTLTLDALGKLPVLGTQVRVRVLGQLRAEQGVVRVQIRSVEYGAIRVSGDAIAGLADELNRELAGAVDRETFAVEDVETTPEAIVLRLRVVGERGDG